MKNRSLTLIELIVALLLLSGILLTVSGSIVFFVRQIKANLEKSDILSEINYCLEDAKLRCVSATELKEYFSPPAVNSADEKSEITFRGEANIYHVTPDDLTDNVWYKYYINADSDLVLRNCGASSNCNAASDTEEVLVEAKYEPQIKFIYEYGFSPSVLMIEVSAQNKNYPLGSSANITKEAGIRFWFIDIAQ